MNASEARNLTAIAQSPAVEGLVEHCYRLIAGAAKKGERRIMNPLQGIRTPISEAMKDAIYAKLTLDGYKVTHHPEPDPGHPCSAPYTTVEW